MLLMLVLVPATSAWAQLPDPPSFEAPEAPIEAPETPLPEKPKNVCKGNFFKNILCDQKAIWTSPRALGSDDARWLLPLGVATAGLIATDRRTAGSLDEDPSRFRISNAISHAGAGYGVGAIVAATYLIGRGTSSPKLQNTGKLAAEALINAAIVDFTFKGITQRPRPREDGGRGRFFTGGASHPSGHSAAIWSVATVFACQYKDQPVVHYGSYAVAGAVGISRFTAHRHFLSDILVGSALGYGIGRYVCRMAAERDDSGGTNLTERERNKFLPSEFKARVDRRQRDYRVALVWSF